MIVDRWKRYGKDRLYVTLRSPDGGDAVKVGWWDLLAGEAHPESPEHAALLDEAVARWRSGDLSLEVPAPAAVPARETEPLAASAPWHDLALNRPGESARAEAIDKRAEAPVKSLLARALGVHTDERAWRIGADGEELVAAQLTKAAKKDPRWRLLHSIPVGKRGSDIDHLIIGPGGVFTANAKHHPKAKIWVGGNTLLVDGHKTTHIRNARYEAERASRLLTDQCGFPVYVHGLVVTVNASDITIKSQPEGVDVTWRNNLVKWLLGHGEILTADVIEAIYEVSRRSTTWTV